jgi:hypothetical protein
VATGYQYSHAQTCVVRRLLFHASSMARPSHGQQSTLS